MTRFAGLARYHFSSFLIRLDYVIAYFSFYYIVKKIFLKKNMLLNFRKFVGMLTGMTSLTFIFINLFFSISSLILN
jgi:hypothetical protein